MFQITSRKIVDIESRHFNLIIHLCNAPIAHYNKLNSTISFNKPTINQWKCSVEFIRTLSFLLFYWVISLYQPCFRFLYPRVVFTACPIRKLSITRAICLQRKWSITRWIFGSFLILSEIQLSHMTDRAVSHTTLGAAM